MRSLLVALIVAVLAGCAGEDAPSPTYYDTDNPERLSAWGMMSIDDGVLRVSDAVLPYDLATPLFSDYALKLRTVWTPGGAPATYDPAAAFDFPVGTVVTKTFYYAKAGGIFKLGAPVPLSEKSIPLDDFSLVETRLLVRRDAGWVALPYVWNDDQSDAVLKRTGDLKAMTIAMDDGTLEDFVYLVPDANQCAACHVTNADVKALSPIGLKARHLNKPSTYAPGFNQLDHWLAAGRLSVSESADDTIDAGRLAPANAVWTDPSAPLDARARAYLDINCSHCHNPNGAADTSGLNLEPDASGPALGVCKPPIAAGGGTGGRAFGIVPGDPDASITVFRMETTDPGAMMPELGRALPHGEGVALVRAWIAAMNGDCS